ncbi:MAG: helix-turn-helix domain-containing protein [Streptosporangiaceae bacterium]
MTVQEPLAGLREAIAAARTEAGGILAGFRRTAGLSQVQLAAMIGYSATAVAHAERAVRPVSAEFWELADEALGAGGRLTAQGARIKDLVRAMHKEQRRLEGAVHARQLSRLLSQPDAADTRAILSAAGEAAVTTATPAAGRCPHCHQPVTLVTQLTAPADAQAAPRPPP